jgi:hypothetical protein
MISVIEELQDWYQSNCDGDWEHHFGVVIETLDNPGWLVTIDLDSTDLAGRIFEEDGVIGEEQDWIQCRVEGTKFKGAGSPHRLAEIIRVFLDWAKRA